MAWIGWMVTLLCVSKWCRCFSIPNPRYRYTTRITNPDQPTIQPTKPTKTVYPGIVPSAAQFEVKGLLVKDLKETDVVRTHVFVMLMEIESTLGCVRRWL